MNIARDRLATWHRGYWRAKSQTQPNQGVRVGTSGPETSDAGRWREALSLLDHTEDAATKQHLRRRRRTALLIVAGVILIAALGSGFLGMLVASSGHHPAHQQAMHTPLWRGILGLAVSLCGLALLIAGLVKRVRSGAFSSDWSAPIIVLTRRQRRHLLRQVDGKTPADPDQLPLARDAAWRLTRQEGMLRLVLSGVALTQVGQLIVLARLRFALLLGAVLLAFAVLAVVLHRRATRAGLFLHNHPPRDTAEAADSR